MKTNVKKNNYICQIMGLFNFFGDNEYRVFKYRPRYYNVEEEERRRKFGHVDGTFEKEKKEGNYSPGSYIKGNLRDGNYQDIKSPMKKTHTFIGIITMILIFVMLILIARFYSLL